MRYKTPLLTLVALIGLAVVAYAQREPESASLQKEKSATPRDTSMPMLTEDKATIPTLEKHAGTIPTLDPPSSQEQPDTAPLARRSALGVELINTPRGPMVQAVYVDSPAAEAGLRTGDLIVGLDGVTLPSVAALASAIARIPPGEQVTIDISRGGQSIRTTTRLADRADSFGLGQRRTPPRQLDRRPVPSTEDKIQQMQYELDALKEQLATMRQEMIELQQRVRTLSSKSEPPQVTLPPHAGAIIDNSPGK